MTRFSLAFPAGILLATAFIPSVGQCKSEEHLALVPPGISQTASPATEGAPKTGLSDEQMGDLYMVRREYRDAALAFKRAVSQTPGDAVVLNKLGIALHKQDALGLALRYYELAAKADPEYADVQNNIGTIWYERKRYRKAVKAYERGLKVRQDMPVIYSNLGYAYFGEKKYEESIAAFRAALKIDPQFFEHSGSKNGTVLQDRSVDDRGRFYFLLAKSFAQSGNLERCALYLRKAKEEGYAALASARRDEAFSAILRDPAITEELSPKAPEKAPR